MVGPLEVRRKSLKNECTQKSTLILPVKYANFGFDFSPLIKVVKPFKDLVVTRGV